MKRKPTRRESALQREVEDLRQRLSEAEETLHAIREGEVDALVVSGPKGDQLYSLVGAESIYRLIVETMKEAAFTATFDGRILYCNAQLGEMLGLPPEKILGHSLSDFVAANELPAVQGLLKFSQTEPQKRRLVFQRADGSPLPAHIAANVLNQPDGMSICIVATDLTELENSTELIRKLRRQQEALSESEQRLARLNLQLEEKVQQRTAELSRSVTALEHFSYSLVHDMRAPLRAMEGFVSIIFEEHGAEVSAQCRELLERIANSARRMDRLIIDTLEYSRAVRQHLPMEPVDLNALLRGMLASYLEFQPPKADVCIEDRLPRVLANEAGLIQCFSCLLDNAVKFVAPGRLPVVRISASRDDGFVRVFIKDNGIGIAAEMHERIFGMFQRASRDYEGAGIGLSLARALAGKMEGSISVQSQLDRGSTFCVQLRAAPE